jgi:NAD(P)H-flavin reductase
VARLRFRRDEDRQCTHARVGDNWLGPLMGRLRVEPNGDREVLMIVGGTGTAPIKALLVDLRTRPHSPHTELFIGGWIPLRPPRAAQTLFHNVWLDVIPVVTDEKGASGVPDCGHLGKAGPTTIPRGRARARFGTAR